MQSLSKSLSGLTRSGIRWIFDMAVQRKQAFHLEIGDPGFPTPLHIQEAAMKAIRDGHTHYVTHAGMPSLREAILNKVQRENGIRADLEQIGVTPGGVFAVGAAFMAVSQPGDEILLPDPGFPIYFNQAVVIGLKPVYYPLALESGFQPDLASIERLITPKTRALVINSPANPTGVIFPKKTLEALLDLCRRRDIFLISDEVYEKILYEGQHFSPASIDSDGKVITIFSTSKTYAMAGWRIGYYVAPNAVAKVIGRAVETYVSCASSVSQKAAEAALNGPQECVTEMVKAYTDRKEICVNELNKANIDYAKPQGAFYITVGIGNTLQKSYNFCKNMLDATGVATAPGLTFGPGSDSAVRLSFCAAREEVAEGIHRFCDYYRELMSMLCTGGMR